MMYWKCILLNRSGEEFIELINGQKKDIIDVLARRNLQVIEIKPDYLISFSSLFVKQKLNFMVMANFFKDFHQLLETGMVVNQAITILKETSQEEVLKKVLSGIEERLKLGQSLTVIFFDLKVFPWIVRVTLSAGEKAGRLSYAIGVLGVYFDQSNKVKSRLKQAMIYPVIVFLILISLMLFVSLRIVPQLKSLLPENALNSNLTQGVLVLSLFIQNYLWLFVLLLLTFIFGIIYLVKKRTFDYQAWMYQWPVIGNIFKESALALYLLNLSVLLKSGVPLLRAMTDLNVLDQSPVAKHFEQIRDYILGGSSFWAAIEQDSFFPKIISSTFRRAEEMTKLEDYALSLSEYYQLRLNQKIDGIIHIIQPLLLSFGGLFLIIIAFAFLFPIYSNLTNIAGG